LTIYQIPGSAQRKPCEPRQAGNGATVATAACVAAKSGVWPSGGFTDEENHRNQWVPYHFTALLVSQLCPADYGFMTNLGNVPIESVDSETPAVVFRVVRIDSDGSATIVWKLLKNYGKPEFTPAQTVE
jgi:hypothetical protein